MPHPYWVCMINNKSEHRERLEYLFSHYINNKATQDELKELATLLKDPENELLLSDLMEGDWKQFTPDIQLKTEHADKLFTTIRSQIHKPNRSVLLLTRPSITWRIAASIALILVVSSLLILQFKDDLFGQQNLEMVTIENPTTKRSELILPDGSKVWLNAESKLIYPLHFQSDKREITLQGEAFFEVVRNERQPFTIISNHVSIQVLGTSFNVKTYDNENSEITVRTGKVQVQSRDKNQVLLTANQQISFSVQHGFSTVKQVDAEDFMAWKEGVLLFDNKNLKELTSILGRWYGKKIIVKNEKLNKCQLVGRHKNESLEDILSSMQFILDMTYVAKGDTILIDGKGCD